MMKCPVCHDVRMREVEKDGVMIDICPDCKGVWLDRGELEKLMSGIREVRPAFNEWYDRQDQQDHTRKPYPSNDHYGHSGKDGYEHGHHKKRKKNVLDVFGDLFD